MDPLVDNARAAMRLSPRKLAVAGGAVVVVIVVIVVVFLLVSGDDDLQGAPEVSAILVEAIAATSPAAAGGSTAGFDTAALRTTVQDRLDGWLVDLAAADGASRIGIAARQVQGTGCVFAWSDVGAPRSATVTDPALPCEAEIALVAAKRPA
jgi:hypothetical protein